jgi:hypothetical protein
MSTIELAKNKWARKMADAGSKWKAAIAGKSGAYAAGLSRFAGVPAGSTMPSHYGTGVDAVSASEFGAAVAGKETKWADKLKQAITS